jgi:predicted esterase
MHRWAWRASSAVVVGGCVAAMVVGRPFIAAAGPTPASAPASAPAPTPTPTPAPAPPALALPPATDLRLSLGPNGHIGAWLLAGTFDPSQPLAETSLTPRLGPDWRIATSADSPLDVAAALDSKGKDRLAYAGGILHVEHGGRHYLFVGADDGLGVVVDGKRIFTRDEVRPQRDDDDTIALDLAAGDHTVLLVLHQDKGAWSFRARVLDADLQPPRGAWWLLPGTTADDARAVATRLSVLSLDRGLHADGWRPVLGVRFPQGAPRGVKLDVRAKLVRATTSTTTSTTTSPAAEPLFDVAAGDVGIDERSVRDLTVTLPQAAPNEVEDDDWNVHVDVAGRAVDLPMHPRRDVREAVARADRALAATQNGDTSFLPPGSLESVQHLRDRLAAFAAHGDAELDAQADDARELDEIASVLEKREDPYASRTGVMRRAYRDPADGKLSEFALWVPPDFDPAKKYPLIVALHGMNGHPMQMLQWLFGYDDPLHDGNWEDRHPHRELPTLEAIVVAPDGHFNTMYRDLGEDDVMHVTDWAMKAYPIDEARVTITGPSMGGIGTAACAFHHPDRFAAAEPLCGYHSYFVRGDIGGRAMRPWERFVSEERSNTFWAENGLYIPLFIVHGKKDLPEENSGVLIDRYKNLGYFVKHEHPDLGHNVWQTTYEGLKGASWLMWNRRPLHPRAIRFKTPRTRWADDAWVHVREMAQPDAWGEVIAHIGKDDNTMRVSTRGIGALALDRDSERIDDSAPVTVSIDGSKLTFPAGEPIELHKSSDAWRAGRAQHAGLFKSGHVTGPIRDVFHEPILFVWGAADPAQARANEDAARGWARVRWGVHVDYPVMSDEEFQKRGESLANDHALFLVGNAKSNRLVRELEPDLPIRIEGDDIVLGTTRVKPKEGTADHSQLGVAFVRPNPRRADRYVVVVEGVGPLGTERSLSLPDMLPDFVVFDEDVGPARGGLILGAGQVRAAGTFTNEWALPPL